MSKVFSPSTNRGYETYLFTPVSYEDPDSSDSAALSSSSSDEYYSAGSFNLALFSFSSLRLLSFIFCYFSFSLSIDFFALSTS